VLALGKYLIEKPENGEQAAGERGVRNSRGPNPEPPTSN